MRKQISIREYGFISYHSGEYPFGSSEIDRQTFEEIKKLVLKGKSEASQIFSLSIKKGFGEIIKAQNYVGIVQTKTGYTIEILPKISSINDPQKIRLIFLKMLKTLPDSSFKKIGEAHLKSKKFTILEVFIHIFLEEVGKLIKRGIKKGYVSSRENLNHQKGKLQIKENIKENFIHKERFFCEYDEFTENIKENRLIKSCLLFLQQVSNSHNNQKAIKETLFIFGDIPESKNHAEDLKTIKNINRLHSYYVPTLQWVNIFLSGKSITTFTGDSLSFALLFPMEKLFESYVSHQLKKRYRKNIDIKISTQDNKHHLIEQHCGTKKFRLKPDIIINKGENIIIADTKWKIIDQEKPREHYNISQADLYQMFAYSKKYKSKEVYLIYPHCETFDEPLPEFCYSREEGERLLVIPYNLENDCCRLLETV